MNLLLVHVIPGSFLPLLSTWTSMLLVDTPQTPGSAGLLLHEACVEICFIIRSTDRLQSWWTHTSTSTPLKHWQTLGQRNLQMKSLRIFESLCRIFSSLLHLPASTSLCTHGLQTRHNNQELYIKQGCASVRYPLTPKKCYFRFVKSFPKLLFLLCKKKVKHDPT